MITTNKKILFLILGLGLLALAVIALQYDTLLGITNRALPNGSSSSNDLEQELRQQESNEIFDRIDNDFESIEQDYDFDTNLDSDTLEAPDFAGELSKPAE
ncbi:MAG: hypothetical protein AAB490_04275 [Patescibacteria group bacterium]